MANLALLTQLVADEALEAELATEAALAYLRHALSDGVFSPDEAAMAVQKLEDALREAKEAKAASEMTYARHRAAETLMRGGEDDVEGVDWSPYRLRVLRDAGLAPVEMPANVVAFTARNANDAA